MCVFSSKEKSNTSTALGLVMLAMIMLFILVLAQAINENIKLRDKQTTERLYVDTVYVYSCETSVILVNDGEYMLNVNALVGD